MKIYIAGKISGEPTAPCTIKFGTIQKALENLGHQAVNPLEVCMEPGITWHDAMRKDIKALMDCEAIYLLPDHIHSRGALLEKTIAQELDMPLIYDLKTAAKYAKVVQLGSKMNS